MGEPAVMVQYWMVTWFVWTCRVLYPGAISRGGWSDRLMYSMLSLLFRLIQSSPFRVKDDRRKQAEVKEKDRIAWHV
jgi:hypothetical protein